jgi:hypothetical protein
MNLIKPPHGTIAHSIVHRVERVPSSGSQPHRQLLLLPRKRFCFALFMFALSSFLACQRRLFQPLARALNVSREKTLFKLAYLKALWKSLMLNLTFTEYSVYFYKGQQPTLQIMVMNFLYSLSIGVHIFNPLPQIF